MDKSFIRRTRRQQEKVNNELSERLVGIGLAKFSLEQRKEEEKSIGLTPATRERQKETEQCVSWRKYFQHGYFIEVFPTFNEKTKTFSQGGIASVLVKVPSKKKGFRAAFEMYFYRRKGMIEKIETVVTFLDGVLQNIPRDRKNSFMELIREGDGAHFYFVSNSNKNEFVNFLDRDFLDIFPEDFQIKIRFIFDYRNKYHDNKDPNVRSIREIKAKRKVRKPKNAVPSYP